MVSARSAAACRRLRADIDYGFAEANTTYGQIGVKVWLYKGDRHEPQLARDEEYRVPRRGARASRRSRPERAQETEDRRPERPVDSRHSSVNWSAEGISSC